MFPARSRRWLVAFEIGLAVRKNDHPIGFERTRFPYLFDPAGIANGRFVWPGPMIGCWWLCLARRSKGSRVGRRSGAFGGRHRRSADWKGCEMHFVRPQSDALTRLGILGRKNCQTVSGRDEPPGLCPGPRSILCQKKIGPGERNGARGSFTCRDLRSGRRRRRGRRGSRCRPRCRSRFRRSCAGCGA